MEILGNIKLKQNKKQFKARTGSHFTDKQANIIGNRIDYLMHQNNNKIKPDTIVQDAKSVKSPIHNFFEWNNTIAAKKYRLEQAKNMIANIVIVEIIDNKQQEVRSYPNIIINNSKYYIPMEIAIKNKEYRKQLIDNLISVMENATSLLKIFRRQQ